VDDIVSNRQGIVYCFETFRKETAKVREELEDGMSFANAERENTLKRN